MQLQIYFRTPIRNFQRDFEELCGMLYFLYKDRLKESGCQLGSFVHNLLKKYYKIFISYKLEQILILNLKNI